jgi:uncharacterized Tic20 family protein
MKTSALAALGLILGYGVFHDGEAHRTEWLHCLVAFGILGSAYAVFFRQAGPPGQERRVWWILAVVALIFAIQLLPLPAAVLRILSPGSAELFQAALEQSAPRAVPISVAPSATYRQIVNLLAYLLVFALITDPTVRWTRSIWLLAGPLMAIGFLEALLGFLQFSYGDSKLSVSGTYANRNHFAGLLEMCLPFAAMLPVAIWRRRAEDRDPTLSPVLTSCFFLIVATIILIAIMQSLSRMGFVATLISLFVIAVAAQTAVALGVSAGVAVSADRFQAQPRR